MSLEQMDALMLRNAFLSAAKSLEAKKEWVNELNVFPVPDGDTGTNMTMTIMSAAKEVLALSDNEINTANVAKAISSGSLRGARGNSGVILSQLLRGFTRVIKENDTINVNTLALALNKATETAYKAVMKPKEGTILTVAKGMSDFALALSEETEDIIYFFEEVVKEGERVLLTTPELLPVLKQAGVVDSGGQGLMEVMKGALASLKGEEPDLSFDMPGTPKLDTSKLDLENIDTADIKFGYCTEFIINIADKFTEEDELHFKEYLESIGDSIVCVADDDIVKIHVHTNDPGLAIQKALTYGSLSRMKIDNMREEHEERLIKDSLKLAKEQALDFEKKKEELYHKDINESALKEKKEYAFISVSVGDGLSDIFRGIGADYIIEGGQTMNPSTEDILTAIDKINADKIFILPNNKNIYLAASQAASLTKDKEVYVVNSKTIPQGITALINYVPEYSTEENIENMTKEMENVKTLSVTYAVRDTNIDGFDIVKGDIMAIGDSGIVATEKDINKATKKAIENAIDNDTELISIYYGSEVQKEIAENLLNELCTDFPNIEFELQHGGQPVYYYLISVE